MEEKYTNINFGYWIANSQFFYIPILIAGLIQMVILLFQMNHYVKDMTNIQEGWWIEIHL